MPYLHWRTITSSSTNFPTGNYASDSDYILEGKVFHLDQVMKSATKMQFKASVGTIYNKENFGRITTVVINYDGTDSQKNCVLTAGTTANPTDGDEITPSISGNTYTFDLARNNYTHFVIVNGSSVGYLSSIVITYEKTYSTITNVTSTPVPRTTDIEANELVIVKSPAVLTFSGSNKGNSGNLIIEEGAQLIVSSNNVPATFKKSIDAPEKTDVYGWYTISSPVHDGTSNVSAISSSPSITSVTYDMFAYKESEHKWLNQRPNGTYGNDDYSAGFANMTVGQGYIYRSSDNEIEFVGNVNYGEITITGLTYSAVEAGVLAGFHLFGNPYSHNITLLNTTLYDDKNEVLGTQLSGYYILRDDSWGTQLTTEAIAPNQGFLVKISSSAKKIVFSETTRGVNYHNDNIKFMVANNQHEDVTYALFKDAIGLNKIGHRNPEVPMLYINQNGEDFAIAPMSDDTKSFNLNFKAGIMGKYTLSYKADGEFNYLHIYDRLTNTDVDMLLEGEYSFIATPNDNENRFIVMLGYMPDYSEGNNDIFVYQSGNDVLVSGSGELQIFDVTGRMIMNTKINGAESVNVPAHGVYIFRLVGTEVKTQKIVVR